MTAPATVTRTLSERVDNLFVAIDHGCKRDEVRFEAEKLRADLEQAGIDGLSVSYPATDDAPED